ncbi:MAG: toll/interleukin-1 receptor domain-containing protein [Luteolibacter sp.]
MSTGSHSKPLVFISFSNADRPTAEAACAMLESEGVECWIAPRNIPPGVPYAEGIMSGLNAAQVMILIFSSHANGSPHVQREVERAINRSMPVIPFRIENVPPSSGLEYFLSLPNWLDAFSPPLEPYLRKLVKSVKDLLGHTSTPEPKAVPIVEKKAGRKWGALAALGLAVAVAITWVILPDKEPAYASKKDDPAPIVIREDKPEPVVARGREGDFVVNFSVPDIQTASNFQVAAAPYLHDGKISIDIGEVIPAGSRVVLVNNMGLYEGKAVKPTVSQNMLTQMNTGNVAASFVLSFPQPLKAVSFMVPRVWPATESGITFPAWKAIALSSSGEELSSASLGLLRRFADEPAKTYHLTAPGFEGIAAVRFESDPRIEETPFAAFSAILIEEIKLTP